LVFNFDGPPGRRKQQVESRQLLWHAYVFFGLIVFWGLRGRLLPLQAAIWGGCSGGGGGVCVGGGGGHPKRVVCCRGARAHCALREALSANQAPSAAGMMRAPVGTRQPPPRSRCRAAAVSCLVLESRATSHVALCLVSLPCVYCTTRNLRRKPQRQKAVAVLNIASSGLRAPLRSAELL
jgi:hypothetical protein